MAFRRARLETMLVALSICWTSYRHRLVHSLPANVKPSNFRGKKEEKLDYPLLLAGCVQVASGIEDIHIQFQISPFSLFLSFATEHFKILEPQILSIDIFRLRKFRSLPDFEALSLRNVQSRSALRSFESRTEKLILV